jgi:hypothetical protein
MYLEEKYRPDRASVRASVSMRASRSIMAFRFLGMKHNPPLQNPSKPASHGPTTKQWPQKMIRGRGEACVCTNGTIPHLSRQIDDTHSAGHRAVTGARRTEVLGLQWPDLA